MISSLIAKLVVFALRHKDLKTEDKSRIVSEFLSKNALPIQTILDWDRISGQLIVSGKPLDREKTMQLRESAKAVLSSQARKLVLEQIAFMAITQGVHEANTPDQVLFAKAALWIGNQENDLLVRLAQTDEQGD